MSDSLGKSHEDERRPFVVGVIFSAQHPHAGHHLKTLDSLREVSDIHLCAIEGGELEQLAGLSSKVRTTTRALYEFLRRPELEALVVCVRNDLGDQVLQTAVDVGLPAIFEKPGALSAAGLRRVAESARSRGVTLGAMMPWRWNPMIQEIRQAVREGAIGRVMAVEARQVTTQVRYRNPSHWIFRRDLAGSGILAWLGCHLIDMLCFLLNERIVDVTAMVGNQNPEIIEVEDTACLAFRFRSGTLGTLQAGYLLAKGAGGAGPSYDQFLALRGTDGWATLDLTSRDGYTLMSTAPGWDAGGLRRRHFDVPQSNSYAGVAGQEFVSAFLAASRAGRPAPSPIEDAVHVLEIIEAALESSATDRAVRIPQTA